MHTLNTKKTMVILSSALALGVSLAETATADPTTNENAQAEVAKPDKAQQQRIAESTMKLEKAFAEQFVNGHIDRAALSGPIAEVVQAMPEAARPKVQDHINDVLSHGEKAAASMTPEERTQLAQPPAKENVGKSQEAQCAYWGWGGAYGYPGWGGWGAFGWPYYGTGLYGYGGYGGYGYGYPYYGTGWGSCGYGYGYSVSYASSCGGIGWGGYWY